MRLAAIGVSVVLAGAILSSGSAVAAQPRVCTFEMEADVTPGVTATPHPTTFTSEGLLTCPTADPAVSDVASMLVYGEGGIGPQGGESCALDELFRGTILFDREKSDSALKANGYFSATRVAQVGQFLAETNKGPIRGSFLFLPADGQDCLNTPITDAHVTGQALLPSFR